MLKELEVQQLGLIGKTLSHSFSKRFFSEKFEREGLLNKVEYLNFELASIEEVKSLLALKELVGFNITIPYKEEIISFADVISEEVKAIGAANVMVRNAEGKWMAFNTDYIGFINSLHFERPLPSNCKALVLGTGGASKAIQYALRKLDMAFLVVSSSGKEGTISYNELTEKRLLNSHQLIINTTPLGTFPAIEALPPLAYEQLNEGHFLYDLVYNPALTSFLKEGEKRKACIRNGYDMLLEQALASLTLWQEKGVLVL